MGSRQLTTPPEGPFPPANHSVTTRVSEWGSGDGYNSVLDGVSSFVQITVLWARARFDQPYVGRRVPNSPFRVLALFRNFRRNLCSDNCHGPERQNGWKASFFECGDSYSELKLYKVPLCAMVQYHRHAREMTLS
jgi:hypothetical protein